MGQGARQELQDWNRKHKRPLIWADGDDTAMLLDPTVDGLAAVDRNGTRTSRFTDNDRQLFKNGWTSGHDFAWLASMAGPHLHLKWPSWYKRHICKSQDASTTQFVLGVDGNDECVYWEVPVQVSDSAPTGATTDRGDARWECLNNGGCVRSNSSRALFLTEQDCTNSGCSTSFTDHGYSQRNLLEPRIAAPSCGAAVAQAEPLMATTQA